MHTTKQEQKIRNRAIKQIQIKEKRRISESLSLELFFLL